MPFAALADASDAREAALPPATLALLRELAHARGLALDLDALAIEQRVVDDEGERVVTLGVEAWAAQVEGLLAAARVDAAATPALPHVTAGGVLHLMLQAFRCDGYDDELVLENVRSVRGSWDIGFHFVLPDAGVDVAEPTAVPDGSSHADATVRGLGDVAISETYVRLFGICLLTVGTMSGAGAFYFDPPTELR